MMFLVTIRSVMCLQAKGKRRFVLGLREVTKHLRLKKIKCVIVSPNLEKIQSKGSCDCCWLVASALFFTRYPVFASIL